MRGTVETKDYVKIFRVANENKLKQTHPELKCV